MKKSVSLTPDNLDYLVKHYRHDLRGFIEDVLCFHKLCDWQIELCEQVQNNRSQIAVTSCTGSGKSSLMSCIAIWRILLFYDSRVIVTSATYGQLKAGFIFAIQSIIEDSFISNWFTCTMESVTVNGITGNSIDFRNWQVNNYQTLAGIHSEHLLHIGDEASVYPDELLETIDGNLQTDHSMQVLISNPTRRSGKIFDIFSTKNDWYKIRISALEVPHISDSWIDKMKDVYGEDSNAYIIRVLGEFGDESEGSFISETLTRRALQRQVKVNPSEQRIAGLDVADSHDETVLSIKQGNEIKVYPIKCDIDLLHTHIYQLMITERIDQLFIDAQGLGVPVYKALLKLTDKVRAVKFGKCGAMERSCSNLRTLYWWRLKEFMKTGSIKMGGASLKGESKIVGQAASLLYSYDELGRYKLEKKEDAKKKRGVQSPDMIDSLAYCFAIGRKIERKAPVGVTQVGSLI